MKDNLLYLNSKTFAKVIIIKIIQIVKLAPKLSQSEQYGSA